MCLPAYEAIFLQDTALDMNTYEMIVTSLDVQGAFPHARHRLLTEVWEDMGLPLLSFMTRYIQIWLYAVITAAGLTPWTGTDSGVPNGGAQGPFFHLLVTLPLAFELARVYLGYAPYPLRSPLINFADDNLVTTATRHCDPENAVLPTPAEQASAILQLTTTYLDAVQLLVHPRKSVGLADTGTPTPHIRKGKLLHLEDTTVHLGVTRPRGTTTSHSQAIWKGASPGYPNLPGGTSCLRRAWHTSWNWCSTQPSGTKPCTSRIPKTPYAKLDSK